MFKINIITLSFILSALLFFIISCDKKRVFEENKKIPGNTWDQYAPVSFTVDIKDTINKHNLYLNVRNAGFYGFSNLFLFVHTTLPQGQQKKDTIEYMLATPEGKWTGSGLGDIWDNRLLYKKNISFPQTGTYRFELTQAMRLNPLPGIMDVGIRIEKAE